MNQYHLTPIVSSTKTQSEMVPGVDSIDNIKWVLDNHNGAPRPFELGTVFNTGCNTFSLLYRYYVLSTSTGADHLFYFRSTGNNSDLVSLYPFNVHLKDCNDFSRKDTRGVLEHYVKLAYRLTGTERKDEIATPIDDLKRMVEFWLRYHGKQDSIIICLEIQQRLLYEYCRRKLFKRVADYKTWI